MKKNDILLKCGVTITLFGKGDIGEVSLIDLYNGYGSLSSFIKVSALFLELDEMGYEPSGMMRTVGYYESTDDIKLDFSKKIKQ